MKAVIMAGGFGTRIQPLTNSVPKPMLPVVNVPMMEHILVKVRDELGVKEFVILLYFKPEVIKEHFGSGEDFGVSISYVTPDDDYGTAGAVGQARELLDETFIIVSGDLVTNFDLTKVIDFHNEKSSQLTITLTPVENPLQFGVVITDENHQIQRFLEKPSWGEVFSDTINTGIYIIEPEILEHIPKSENFDFSKDLFPALMQNDVALWGCPIEGYWRDVGNPMSYREVHEDILEGKVAFDIDGVVKQDTNCKLISKGEVSLPENIKVIGTVVIDEGVTLGENITLENCVIGKNSTIEANTKVRNSVIWHNVLIKAHAHINKAVICNDTILEEQVFVRNGAIIAEDVKIGQQADVVKDIFIWPKKFIESGSVVSQNVVLGEKYKATLFNKGRVSGKANAELSSETATKIAEAFGSILPIGSTVYVSRDYHRASRMLKRFVLGGVLSVGVNAIDIQATPSNVVRRALAKDDNAVAGIHIRQSVKKDFETEIIFFTSEGLLIDTSISQSIEKIYFNEKFRRVSFDEVGTIFKGEDLKLSYKDDVASMIDSSLLSKGKTQIAVDLMHGMTSDIYPALLDRLDIENIMLNAYTSEKRLSTISSARFNIRQKLAKVVAPLNLDAGLAIFPNGQRVDFICDDGKVIPRYKLLLSVIYLLHIHNQGEFKIYLPAWAPDVFDGLSSLHVERGKIMGKKAEFLKEFYLIADTDAHFTFTEFGLHSDSLFASLKILELLKFNNISLSQVIKEIPDIYYSKNTIDVPSNKKGKIMREFVNDVEGGDVSHVDGIKIKFNQSDWALIIPDDYDDMVYLYIQAQDSARGEAIKAEYIEKIESWIRS